MEYFCAQCQKKHSVRDIAADLREISRQKIVDQLAEIFETEPEREDYYLRYTLSANLKRFVNSDEKSGKYFLFKSYEIASYLKNVQRNGTVLSGTFCLSLQWLLEKYEDSGTYQEDYPDESGPDIDQFFSKEWEALVYWEYINFYFERVEQDYLFNYMTDNSGDPFSDDKDVMRGYLRACPHCGYHVARAVGRGEEIIIALAGSPRAGKSSCLTSIASSLDSCAYDEYGFTLEALDNDRDWMELKKEISWYEYGYAVTKTPVDIKSVPAYSLLVKHNGKRRVLTFVDMPGEFWQSGNGLSKEFFMQYAGLYRSIDCIWFFVSKMTAYAIDLGYGEEDWQKKLIEEAAEDGSIIRKSSVTNLRASLRTLREQLAAYNTQLPPIAVILSKGEMELSDDDVQNADVYGLFPVDNGHLISDDIIAYNRREFELLMKLKPGRTHERVLNEWEYFSRSSRVREFFRAVNPGICSAVEENCPCRTYISMAAYGHPAAERPTDQLSSGGRQTPEDIHAPKRLPPTPYHEMMPLLWTMAIMGALEIEHRCTWRWRTLLGTYQSTDGIVTVDSFRYRDFIDPRNRPPKAPVSEEQSVKMDVSANLLMRKARNDSLNFTPTTFMHKR